MKILQVFSFFSLPHGGGTVDLVYKISRALQERGHDVTIYTSDFELDKEYVESLQGVTVCPFHSYINFPGFHFTPYMITETRKKLQEFDIIHLHAQRCFQNIVAHHYARKYNIPYVIDAHGSTPLKQREGLKKLFDMAFGRQIWRDCSRFIAESDLGINEYKELGIEQERIALIPPPFPVEDFANLPPLGQFRKEYNIQEKHIIMFFGRINWVKGIDFLVESFYELTKVRNDIILVIVGPDDGYKSTLIELIEKFRISNKVIFTGFLGGSKKLSALVDASVVVQTSRYEQGAWAPFEAVLCGTPIIVSKHTGAGEDVKRIDAGYLVDINNKQELADTLNNIVDDTGEARMKAQKAAQYIEEKLSMRKKIADYENLYRECIQENASKRKRGDRK